MRFAPYIGFFLGFNALSLLAHAALWRWLRRAYPTLAARHRSAALGVIALLFVLPWARGLGVIDPAHGELWSLVAAVGSGWHLATYMAMTPVAAGWLVDHLLRRRRPPSPLLPGRPEGDPPVRPDRRVVLEQIGGTAALAVSTGTLGWGALRGRFEWEVREVPIRIARLPRALDGFTIVQLSDLHVGTWLGERELSMGLSLLEGMRPDLVAITGDIVDHDIRYAPLAARALGALRSREGVVCIPGNHDYYTGAREVLDAMSRAGVDVLLNRGKVVGARDGGGIAIVGVDDIWGEAWGNRGPDLSRALGMVPRDLATVLLAHQPRFIDRVVGRGVDLQLSGHTHGGQINPGFVPSRAFLRYVHGRYDVGDTQLYVNRGFGTAGPPIRVGAPPEITKIVLVAG